MNKKNDKKIELQVVQKNVFIQKYQKEITKLTFNDLLVLKTILSKVNARDTLFKESYTITYAELDKCGFISSHNRRAALSSSLKALARTYFYVDGGSTECGLIENRFVYDKYSKEFKVGIYSEMADFLLNIKEQFTKYPLAVLANLTNKYDLLLFEYFSSISKLGSQKIGIDSLRIILGVGNKYPRASLLKTELLDKSIERINDHTDIEVTFEPYKDKNKIIGFTFHIRSSANYSTKEYLASIAGTQLNIDGSKFTLTKVSEIQNGYKKRTDRS